MPDERPVVAKLCFACGEANPRGLHMHFDVEGDRATAEFTIPEYLQGFPGQAHGGAVATMLDEAMGWAVYGQGIWAMTAKLQVRFRDSVPLGEPLTVSGWVTRDRGRFIELKSELHTADGVLLAEAVGMFARIRGKQAEALRRNYEAATLAETRDAEAATSG